MSGTSADGIDAALVEIEGCGLDTQVHLIAFKTYPYPDGLREDLFRMADPATSDLDRLVRMNVLIGELFADAALRLVDEVGWSISSIDAIGSHGQTIRHLPRPEPMYGHTISATLQIGEPSVIAERTGVTTVADFRPRDMAAGGEGAPLVPLVDYLLFHSETIGRALLNIGGIANVTFLPAGSSVESILAFDLGPGNMVLDALITSLTDGAMTYDQNGERARHGKVDHQLLATMLDHPFLTRNPPKSTGREEFGTSFCVRYFGEAKRRGCSPDDLLATATEFVAQAIVGGLQRFWTFPSRCEEIIASGGGIHNQTLMERLKALLGPERRLRTLEEVGYSSDAKEAVAFAVLANETICGRCNNLSSATGARSPVTLGKIVPGKNRRWMPFN
ncbi:MAG: anhydro-N-acetylmuramic acid kinase [Candidatus Latescibacteria bacterium]|nr:anhydro-N-acetylmuramic acid kinase [Candidatus Latescibacterota bacterium]